MLYYSCKYDYFNLCQILLSTTKVNINCFKSTWVDEIDTINIEKRTVNYEIKKRLISEKTPLATACQNNNIDIIKLLLLDNRIDVNLRNSYIDNNKEIQTKTPLYLAVGNKNFEVVKLLLSHPEVDVNIIFKEKNLYQTALYSAVESEDIEIIKLLLSHPQIDIDKECDVLNGDMSRQTPLSLAAKIGRADIINLLLEKGGVDINKMSLFSLSKSTLFGSEEKTPLYIAIENENLEAAKILLKNEDIKINNLNEIYRENGDFDFDSEMGDRYKEFLLTKFKKTALHIAVQNKLIDCVELLLSNPKNDVNLPCESFQERWQSDSRDYEASFYDVDFYDIYSGNDEYYREFVECSIKKPYILVGLKSDKRDMNLKNNEGRENIIKYSCDDNDIITTEMGEQLKEEIGASAYIECSSLNFINVHEVFEEAAHAVLQASTDENANIESINDDLCCSIF